MVRGIAFDGGYGITNVEFSADGGATWQPAKLGSDLGRYSFREWTASFAPRSRGFMRIEGARHEPHRPDTAGHGPVEPDGLHAQRD